MSPDSFVLHDNGAAAASDGAVAAEPAARVPPAARRELFDLFCRASGAEQAAQAAVAVARERRAAFQAQFRTIVLLLGLDPQQNWSVEFATGAIVPAEPQLDAALAGAHPPRPDPSVYG